MKSDQYSSSWVSVRSTKCCAFPCKPHCLTFCILGLWNGLFHHWIWTCPLLQIGMSAKNQNKMANSADWLTELGFNDTSTLVGHFESSPREREKRDRRESRDEREGHRRKENEWKWRNRRNKNIPPLPLPAARTGGLAHLLANISWTPRWHKIHGTFASPNHPQANSVDPGDMAHYEPSHQDLHCLHRYLVWSEGLKEFNTDYYTFLHISNRNWWQPFVSKDWSLCPRTNPSIRSAAVEVLTRNHVIALTLTTLWAYSADNKLMIFFLFFPENKIWHFMQIVSTGDNLHEMSKPVFREKIRKLFQYAICWKLYPAC